MMNSTKITDKSALQLQYVTNEAGNRTAVILSLNQFDELFQKLTDLTKLVEEFKKAALSASQSATTRQALVANDEDSLHQQITLLQQHYEVLNKILEDLFKYNDLETELDRKLQIQRLLNYTDVEVQKIRRYIGQLKKHTQSATLYQVPELNNTYLISKSIFGEIKNRLLAEATGRQRPPLVLQAPSGTGKSVMATALAHDSEVRQAFPDGIFWLSLGVDADLLVHQVTLLHALDESTTDVFDVDEGTRRLRELCATRAGLIILDDVWDAQDILAFNLEGEHCQLLITSSEGNLSEILQYFINNTKSYIIRPFTEEQAIDFFAHCVGQEKVTAAPIDMGELVSTCGYSPLALKLTAGVARDQPVPTWKALLEQLQNEDHELSNKYPRALMQALQLNVEALGEPADYYLALAVFSDYSHIPQSVVMMLWRYLYHLLNDEAEAFINELVQKGLLRVYERSSTRYLSLHSFQHDYLCAEAELDKLHSHLLTAYRRQCGQHGWISGPNDGYFFEYLCVHLHHAERHNELKLLLLDFDWMQNKLQATSVHALLSDYEWLENDDLEIVKRTLYEAAPVLHTNKPELANQLLDRLWGEDSLKNNKEIQALLNQAKETSPNWHWQPHFAE